MAAGDTAHWLQNKLGSTDDLWSGRSICAQLNVERLQNIQECFHALLPHVKVKLLLTFLHLPRRNIEQWQEDLNFIIQMAVSDSDPWVSMVAEIVRHFPESGSLNLGLQNASDTFAEILGDLKKSVDKSAVGNCMLPLECQYLNKQALNQAAGQIPQLTRHFQIKRKPKSATLRAEILTKSNEAANNKKHNIPNSVPIKSRSFLKKMDTTTPMRGIPSRTPPSSSFRSVPSSSKVPGPSVTVTPLGNTWVTNRPGVSRKEGGVKFLDIGEQPVGAREAKKRKRQADMEAMEQQKKLKEEAAAATAITPNTAPQPFTPDYAAGLMAPATPKMPTPMLSTVAPPVAGPTYVPSAGGRVQTSQPTAATLGGVGALSSQQQARKNLHTTLQSSLQVPGGASNGTNTASTTIISSSGAATTLVRPTITVVGSNVTSVGGTAGIATTAANLMKPIVVSTAAGGVLQQQQLQQHQQQNPPPATIIVQASPQLMQQHQLGSGGQKLVATQVRLPAGVQVQGPGGAAVVGAGGQAVQVRLAAPLAAAAAASLAPPTQPQPAVAAAPATLATAVNPQAAAQPKKGLSLTRDQMMEAQEMFRVSNKVSRPEKALILGFMAGSRENPCPQQGNVLNIKLSENEENVAQADGSQKQVMVDTYFQMNYGSGEWKRFKKYRDIS